MVSWLLLLLLACGAPSEPVAEAPTQTPETSPPAAAVPAEIFRWRAVPDHYPLIPAVIEGYRVAAPPEDETQPRLSRTGDAGWTMPLGRGYHGELDGVALAATDEAVFVAHYQRISSGCTLLAFSAPDAKPLWMVELTGLGPVDHSKYWNRVQLRIEDGNPVVYGHEAQGRYVEQRSAVDGSLVRNERAEDAPIPRYFAESMYAEFARRLKHYDSAAEYVEGFRYRYNLRGPEPVIEAARQLDGTPLPGDRGTMRVTIGEDESGTVVKAHRVP